MKRFPKILAAIVLVLLGAAVWLLLPPAGKGLAKSPQLSDSEKLLRTLHEEQVAAHIHAAATESVLPSSVPDAAAIEETARMYAAHASLRIPEVADPDSVTNRQILQTMVAKALARAQAEESGSDSTH